MSLLKGGTNQQSRIDCGNSDISARIFDQALCSSFQGALVLLAILELGARERLTVEQERVTVDQRPKHLLSLPPPTPEQPETAVRPPGALPAEPG